MINLFTNYYKYTQRQSEIDECIKKNIECTAIDKIFLISKKDEKYTENHKIVSIELENRPKFKDMFDIINKNSTVNDINILCNTDIFFEETSINLLKRMKNNECISLTRWDFFKNEAQPTRCMRQDSQDSWIFKGQIKNGVSGNFYMGTPGCDNRIAFELSKMYLIYNPSDDVKSYHIHYSNARTYEWKDKLDYPHAYLPFTKFGRYI